jgi:hypothetical protein
VLPQWCPKKRKFHWIETLLGNLRLAFAGTFPTSQGQDAQQFIAGIQCDHRLDLTGAIEDLGSPGE